MSFKDKNLFPQLLKNFDKAVDIATQQSAVFLQGQAVKQSNKLIYETPPSPSYKRTGNLKAGILERRISKTKAQVFNQVKYAKYVEYGTPRMPLRPFMRNSFDQNIDNIVSVWSKFFKKNI